MNMRKLIGTASCSLMALSILMQPALAQAPNPGPGWVLVKQRTVRNFAADPAKQGGGAWKLLGVNNRTYFVEDGQLSRTVANTRQEQGEISAGQSARVYSDDQILTRQKGETNQGDVANSHNSYFEGAFLVVYKLTRYSLFEDVTGYKPWSVYNRYSMRTRNVNYYLVEWTDPITNERLSELDPAPEYTDWVAGDPYNKEVASSGKDNFARRDSLGTDDRKVILGKTFSPQAGAAEAASKPASTKVGTFLSNKGSGNSQVSLSGSKLRVAMGANDAVASQTKKVETEGSLQETPVVPVQSNANTTSNATSTATPQSNTAQAAPADAIDKVKGEWQLAGGSESKIKIDREGKSNNLKVHTKLVIVRGADFESDFTVPFASTLSNTNKGRTVSMTFNQDYSKLTIQLGLIKATFVKTK